MGRIPLLELTGEMAPSVQKYSLAYLRPYHREIARRLVLGEDQAEISRELHISESRLSIICNSPIMKNEVARLEAMRESGVHDVTVQLQELAPTMLEVVERLAIYGSKESLRLAAAQDLLDRNRETSKTTKIDSTHLVETHEQRMARLLGIEASDIGMPKANKTINVTPSAQSMDTSDEGEEDA